MYACTAERIPLPDGAHAHAIAPPDMPLNDALAAGPELLATAVSSI